jgi:hypothetical protein
MGRFYSEADIADISFSILGIIEKIGFKVKKSKHRKTDIKWLGSLATLSHVKGQIPMTLGQC